MPASAAVAAAVVAAAAGAVAAAVVVGLVGASPWVEESVTEAERLGAGAGEP